MLHISINTNLALYQDLNLNLMPSNNGYCTNFIKSLWLCYIFWFHSAPHIHSQLCWLHLFRGVRLPSITGLPVGQGWWPVILEDEIMVAKQFMTRQSKWSHDLQHSTLALTGLDRHSERPNPTNWLLMSSPSTYIIVSNVLFKLLWWQTSIQPYFIFKVLEGSGWGSIVQRYQYLKPVKLYVNKWLILHRTICIK